MKTQIGVNAVVIGSKSLALKAGGTGPKAEAAQKALAGVFATAAGKRKMVVVTVIDDNGQECQFSGPLRKYESGSFGVFLSLKGDCVLAEVDAPVGKYTEKAEKAEAKLDALTAELTAK